MMDTPLTLLAEAKDKLTKFVRESGGCDHNVGICCCEEYRLLDRITAMLDSRGWVKVEDRFPPRDHGVWVSNGVIACECHRFWNSRTREEDWAHPFDNTDSPLWWRELPPLPKG